MTPAISPEFIQTLGTGALSLLALSWVLYVQGKLWRDMLLERLATTLTLLASHHDFVVDDVWFGVRVRSSQFTICWRGSLTGIKTVVDTDSRIIALELLTGETLLSLIALELHVSVDWSVR